MGGCPSLGCQDWATTSNVALSRLDIAGRLHLSRPSPRILIIRVCANFRRGLQRRVDPIMVIQFLHA
jgi:hypothetical protein